MIEFAKGYKTEAMSDWNHDKVCSLFGPSGEEPEAGLRTCLKAYYFSNPDVKFYGKTLGEPLKYDNALWLKINRFVLANVGNETLTCDWKLAYFKEIIPLCLQEKETFVDCDDEVDEG